MSRNLSKFLCLFAIAVLMAAGCSDDKTTIPTNLNQPLPKVNGSDGSRPAGPNKAAAPDAGGGAAKNGSKID